MYKIINLKHVAGKLDNGIEYDNHNFTCLSDSTPASLVTGTNVEVLKCKTETFNNVVRSRQLDPATFPGYIIEPYFNQYGKMIDFKIVSPDN